MKRINKTLTLCSLAILVFALGCGWHEQQLVSITVTPAIGFVTGIGDIIPVQYTAYGTYIHPPKTADITDQVTWTSSIVAVGTVSKTGVVTPSGFACGITNITAATGEGNAQVIVTGSAQFLVTDPNVPGCPALPQNTADR